MTEKMSDEEIPDSALWAYFVVYLIVFFWFLMEYQPCTIIEFVFVLILSAFFALFPGTIIWLPLSIVIEYLFNRDRPETTFKSGDRPYTIGDNLGKSTFKSDEVLDKNTLDIYTPVRTSKQWDTVTPVYNIEEVGEYAECPYCGSNIRETFYELGGVVRCNKCGALHHKECFEYYGRKCGSPSCKLRNT